MSGPSGLSRFSRLSFLSGGSQSTQVQQQQAERQARKGLVASLLGSVFGSAVADDQPPRKCKGSPSERGGAGSESSFAVAPVCYLAVEPLTVVLVPEVARHLPAASTASLRAACPATRDAITSVTTGLPVFPHVTPAAKGVDESTVESMMLPASSSDECPEEIAPNAYPNCRTVWWKVSDWSKKMAGEYMESGAFTVQDIPGIYFRFYPRGKAHSRGGYCSLYIGSSGTDRDLTLRLKLANSSHILSQRLQEDYVDGFVNFCNLGGVSPDSDLYCGLEVVCGPRDTDKEKMSLSAGPLWAKWTIPRMTSSYMDEFRTGDRITSDTFTVDGLGEDACFVIYPKGDTVDAISKVGDFVNVGLFGSAERDVTFRLSAGKVSKVMTAASERYRAKQTGNTKSCGEFFDACYAPLTDMVDHANDQLKMTIEVLDTQTEHRLTATQNQTKWQLSNSAALFNQILPGEKLYSRYFKIWSQQAGGDIFYAMDVARNFDGTYGFGLTKVNQAGTSTNEAMLVHVTATVNGKEYKEVQELQCNFRGVHSREETCFNMTKGRGLPQAVKIEIRPSPF